MKTKILLVYLVLFGLIFSYAQTSIVGSKIRIAEKKNGVYKGWTTDWISLSESESPVMEITESKITDAKTTHYVYFIKFKFEGEVTEGTYVYDPKKSKEIRAEWNERVVNCYVDDEGDYIYVEDTSLQQLARDQNAWAKYPNSTIQFINKDMNIAIR